MQLDVLTKLNHFLGGNIGSWKKIKSKRQQLSEISRRAPTKNEIQRGSLGKYSFSNQNGADDTFTLVCRPWRDATNTFSLFFFFFLPHFNLFKCNFPSRRVTFKADERDVINRLNWSVNFPLLHHLWMFVKSGLIQKGYDDHRQYSKVFKIK